MQSLQQYFDLALETPDGIKKLRELILTLAMQGTLVPQNPKDQPAAELLKEIEAEKKRLVKEGKIRKQEPLPPIKPEEIPYGLPKNWQWVRLGDVGTWKSGSTPSRTNNLYYEGNIPWVKSGEVKQGHICQTTETITEKALAECPLTLNPVGSVLIAMYGANIGDVGILEIEATTNQAVCACNPYCNIDRFFLLNLLVAIKPRFIEQGAGAAQPNISREKIINTVIPIPPLVEQHRIVTKIDELMTLCDNLEAERDERDRKRLAAHASAVNRLLSAPDAAAFESAWRFIVGKFDQLYSVPTNVADLKKAILQLAVMGKLVPQNPNDQPAGELLKEIEAEKKRLVKEGKIRKQEPLPPIKPEEIPYELPQNWQWVRLCELVDVETGSTPAKTNQEYYNGTIPWYTSSATNNIIAETPETYITEKAIKETNCKIFPEGSLIIALYGQGKTRGQISEIVVPGATNQAIAAMIFGEISKKTKSYLKYFFIKIYTEIRLLAAGAAQPNLNVGKVKNTLIPLPPLVEQQRIVTEIDELMALCNKLEQQITAATEKRTAIFNAVLNKIAEGMDIPAPGDLAITVHEQTFRMGKNAK